MFAYEFFRKEPFSLFLKVSWIVDGGQAFMFLHSIVLIHFIFHFLVNQSRHQLSPCPPSQTLSLLPSLRRLLFDGISWAEESGNTSIIPLTTDLRHSPLGGASAAALLDAMRLFTLSWDPWSSPRQKPFLSWHDPTCRTLQVILWLKTGGCVSLLGDSASGVYQLITPKSPWVVSCYCTSPP